MKNGHSRKEAEEYFQTREGRRQLEYITFAQEKYSNGETAMQFFEDYLLPDALYLLDEPEVSLSPANQVLLAEEINKMARFLSCQFVIATHSPFMLGTLDAKIYNIDTDDYRCCEWCELENVRYFYEFFKKHEKEFEEYQNGKTNCKRYFLFRTALGAGNAGGSFGWKRSAGYLAGESGGLCGHGGKYDRCEEKYYYREHGLDRCGDV